MTMQRTRRGDGSTPVQIRKTRRNGWTDERKALFLDVLKATSNVTEAVRTVGMTVAGVYNLRTRDPAFAAGWMQALEQGYAELEMLLLRKALYGTEKVETVHDESGEGVRRVKTVHSYPLAVALRLLLAHGSSVATFRAEQGINGPGSEAALAEIREKFALVRARKQAADGHEAGEA